MALSITLSDAIAEYLRSRKSLGARAGTIRSEERALRRLLAVNGNILVRNVTDVHVDRLYAEHHGVWGPSTCNKVRAHLMLFFKWARNRRYMDRDRDPMYGRRPQRVIQLKHLLIPQPRFGELLDSAPNPRDRMVVALGLYMFLRSSEITPIRWADVDLDLLEIDIVRVKTSQRDTLPTSEELYNEIRRWRMAYLEYLRGDEIKREWYFVPRYQRPKMGSTHGRLVWNGDLKIYPDRPYLNPHHAVKRALAALGYETRGEGNHTLRRSGARALYDELVNERGHDGAGRIVQAMLGHSTFAMTERYLGIGLDRKRRDDMLRGKPMFTKRTSADVISIDQARRAQHGGKTD